MSVLVTAASRHGSTSEIAQWIAEELQHAGLDCDVREPRDVHEIEQYDAVIVGSAVYVGQWLTEAKDFVERFATQLSQRHVWLFSSGLADTPSDSSGGTNATRTRMELVGAAGHRHFPGKLDVLQLSLAERAAIMAARGKYGDSRDPRAVREWAQHIAQAVNHPEAVSA